jgi:gamma-glutamylcyclotransferase (GGCT)/AIG2-like uncharacterized protein YtfP
MPVPELLFVYGTLMPMARERGGRPARVHGTLWDSGAYPAVVLTEAGGPVVAGLVFEATPDDLARLDQYEGVEHGWCRRVRVVTVEGEEVWVYEGAGCLGDGSTVRAGWAHVPAGESGVAKWGREVGL